MIHIFDLLYAIRSKLAKPEAQITVELLDTEIGVGLRFQFLWYEDKRIKVSVFISKTEIDSILDDGFLIDRIISMVNNELKKISEGETR